MQPFRPRSAFLTTLLFAVSVLPATAVRAQTLPRVPTGAGVLSVPLSPQQSAMGGTGAALPLGTAPDAFTLNPAQLGVFGRSANVAVRSYPGRVDWLPRIADRFSLGSTALAAGYNLSERLGAPLSVGVGYFGGRFDQGDFERRGTDTDGGEMTAVLSARERFDAFGFGATYGQGARVSVGASLKHVQARPSFVPEFGVENPEQRLETTATTFDVGALASVPLLESTERLTGIDLHFAGGSIRPFVRLSLGYALQNVGGRLDYGQKVNPPMPRAARLGYGARAGVDWRYGSTGAVLRLLTVEASVEAEDELVEATRRGGGGQVLDMRYQGMVGGLDAWGNVALMKGDEQVRRRRGLRFSAAETISVSTGGFDGAGTEEGRTRGLGFRLKGLLKLWNAQSRGQAAAFTAEHVDLRYMRSVYFANDDFRGETTFQSFTLIIGGF